MDLLELLTKAIAERTDAVPTDAEVRCQDEGGKIRKAYQAVSEIQDNRIRVKAAAYGNIDRYGDVLVPGFFKGMTKWFLTNGFISMSHNWGEPAGMPISAKDMTDGLYSEGEFHSTELGQTARTIAVERAEKGLTTGISVAFTCAPGGYAWFSNGEAMAEFMKGAEIDLTGFDMKAIKAYPGYCRLLVKGDTLYEWGIALVPVNPSAMTLEAKGLDGAPPAGVPLERELANALAALQGTNERLIAIKGIRAEEGRRISAARLADAEALYKAFGETLDALRQGAKPLVDGEAETKAARLRELDLRAADMRLSLLTP